MIAPISEIRYLWLRDNEAPVANKFLMGLYDILPGLDIYLYLAKEGEDEMDPLDRVLFRHPSHISDQQV